ncbi:MAG: ribonuclease E inhibitor RraB [Janthinobacterium lividum]
MSDEASTKANLDHLLASNSARIQEMLESQVNVETTRSLVLCFSSPEEDCALAINKALFAKGTRVLQQPECKADGRFHIRVGVKRSIRDVVHESFVADMVHTAAGMNGSYDGWSLLTDGAAEEAQMHVDTPDVQHSPAAVVPQETR